MLSAVKSRTYERDVLPSVPANYVVELVAPGLPGHALSSSPAMGLFLGRLQRDKGICPQNRGALFEMAMTNTISLFFSGGGFTK
jgi:hypothetical protein